MLLLEKDVTSADPLLSSLSHPDHLAGLIQELLRREGISEPDHYIPPIPSGS